MKSSVMNWGAALLLLAAATLGSLGPASAQNEYATPAGANQAAPLFVIGCLDINGRAVPANSTACAGSAWGGGGGGGGSVTQGTVPWVVSGAAGAALASDAHLVSFTAANHTDLAALASDAHLLTFTAANHADLAALALALNAPMQQTGGTVSAVAAAAGGAANYHVIATASDNHVVIKNGAGTVYDVDAENDGTTIQYVRLYDAGTGFNGCNSSTGLVWGSPVPAAAAAAGVGGGIVKSTPVGRAFTTGISICITGAVSDTDTTNAATTTVVNIGYK